MDKISHSTVTTNVCVCKYVYKYRRPDNQEEDFAAARQSVCADLKLSYCGIYRH